MSAQVESYTPAEQQWMDQIIAHEYGKKPTLSHLAQPFVPCGLFMRTQQCRLWNACQTDVVPFPSLDWPPGDFPDPIAQLFVPIGLDKRIEQCRLWNNCKAIDDMENGDLYD
jgi:hypothetical protein